MRGLVAMGFAAAVLAAVLFGADCSYEPERSDCPLTDNTLFAGCFEGEVSSPAGGGKVKIILNTADQPGTGMLGGCIEITLTDSPVEVVTLAGSTGCDPNQSQEATVTGMRSNEETLKLSLVRQPAAGNAVSLDVAPENGVPFTAANALPRCTVPATTCLDLGMRVPFGSGGQP